MDALRIVLDRAELEEAYAALDASTAAHGRKKALDSLARARRRLEGRADDARVTVLLPAKSSEVLADELRGRDTEVSRRTLERVEIAELEASRRPARHAANLPGVQPPSIRARDQRVRNPGHRAR